MCLRRLPVRFTRLKVSRSDPDDDDDDEEDENVD